MKKWLLSIFLLLVLVIFGKEVKIVFLETSDIHGRLFSYDYAVDEQKKDNGLTRVATILKEHRKNKEYLFLGVDFSRDTFRMVANEITVDLKGGTTVLGKEELTKKEDKFIKTHNLTNLDISINEFIKSHG